MQLFAPAKINLSFKILRRREDGFHEIETLMAPISLADELTIEPNESGNRIDFTATIRVCRPVTTIWWCGRRAVFSPRSRQEPRVRIALRKKIPHGAGLGGGSSDAASTLARFERTARASVDAARLTSLAAALGSDVPFFLAQARRVAAGEGRLCEPVEPLPALSLLLLKPEFGVPTPWAYQQWRDSREIARG